MIQLTELSIPGEISWVISLIKEIKAMGSFTIKNGYLYKLFRESSWTFSADLRCCGFESNHEIEKALLKANVLISNDKHVLIDPEMACFYAYFNTKESGKLFLRRLQRWITIRIGHMERHIDKLKDLANELDPLEGSIQIKTTKAYELGKWILKNIRDGQLSRFAKLQLYCGCFSSTKPIIEAIKITGAHTEFYKGNQYLVFD